MNELIDLSIQQTAQGVREGTLRASDIVEAYFKEIDTWEPRVDAFIALMKESARKRAETIEAKRKQGKPLGKLAGVTIALKDNMLMEGHPTTCASKILEGYTASYSATVVEKLEAEDAIIVGKANLDEFAMGSSTENSAYKITKNPWDLSRVPGGSSGGSAAAVAAGMSLAALGSDTGGSIRQPGALTGTVGFKPTYGAVSRYGLVAFASSLDQIGPITRDASDAEILFESIAGEDPKDSTSLRRSLDKAGANSGSRKRRLGIPKEYFEGAKLDGAVEKALEQTIEVFKKEGFEIKTVSLPHTEYALPVYYILAPSEASANLARFDGVRYGRRVEGEGLLELYKKTRTEGFGPEVQRRILIGTFALSHGYYEAYYGKANEVRRRIAHDFDTAFESVDAILAPATPEPAFEIGAKAQDPVSMYLSDIFTIPVNLAGIPAVSIPCGFSGSGLPVGCQLIGPRGSDYSILSVARTFEKATANAFIKRAPRKVVTPNG